MEAYNDRLGSSRESRAALLMDAEGLAMLKYQSISKAFITRIDVLTKNPLPCMEHKPSRHSLGIPWICLNKVLYVIV